MQIYLLVLCLAQVYYIEARAQDFVYLTRGFFHVRNGLQPSCQSQIYCESELMHDVQMSGIYPDSKTFVDKKLKYTESEILEKYYKLKQYNNNQVPSNAELSKFVDENFVDGDELEEWVPSDFTENPSIGNRIRDQDYKQWAYSLNHVWKTLARKVKDDVKSHPDKYSLIWVPNGFVIPGGRFRELYYWDTYWIVRGLLLCDMRKTAQGVIDNIISMVNRFGFMPNGSRVYYLNRTQPPMLILMVLAYYQATNDFDYVKSVLPDLESELYFWLENRMYTFKKDGKTYNMARYYAPSRGPRPESYREDYEIAEKFNTEEEKDEFYINIKSGAETGWDFSSRWFITANGSDRGDLFDIHTPEIIPVDLNSILHVNALTLSTWFSQIGDIKRGEKYATIAGEFLKGIQEVLWRNDLGAWFDWDTMNNKSREYFYVSNIVPLWTGSYDMPKKSVASKVLGYLKDQHVIEPDYSIKYNGTPTSMYPSSQQWDFPNAWPPLQAFIIQGLDRTQQKLAQQEAFKLAEVWLHSNYKGFAEKSMMFEKYDVLASGETGGGGEYTPQTGFGWTNGVVLEFLDRWGDLASYNSNGDQNTTCKSYLCNFNNIKDKLSFWN
ncbi:trehalase-like isoform X2 [Adelges cooleyi]|uniref:trehalase-like isoform X2 n=1 Tax=Adelges cooleyi TaxID=133065 RepID=UPI00217FE866|nr:trehalase-like isoform X2 [Adelges cooleyi]